MKKAFTLAALLFSLVVCSAPETRSQTTVINYQGNLTDAGNPANGTFQMQFKLFDAASGGTQIGPTVSNSTVTVTQGTFKVSLDFGSVPFSGADRLLEIAVRHNAGENYTTLNPRQQIAASPYTIRTLSAGTADVSLDSQKLGGVAANQFVQTSDARLSDARNPLPGSSNYIQNSQSLQTATQYLTGNGYFNGNGYFGGSLGVGISNFAGGLFVKGNGTNVQLGDAGCASPTAAIGFGSVLMSGCNNFALGGDVGSTTPGTYLNAPAGSGIHFRVANTSDIMTVAASGNVGIGTATPTSTSKVEIAAQDGLRITGFQPFLTLRDSATNAVIQNVGGNLYLLGSNVSQNSDRSGLVKFGILVNADGSLNLCFNAQNPATCGVTVSHPGAGVYDLTFPQQINSRIFSATMVLTSNFNLDAADYIYVRPTSAQVLRVRTATYGQVQGNFDTGFYLVVF